MAPDQTHEPLDPTDGPTGRDLTVGALLRDRPVRHLTFAQLAVSSGAFLNAAVLGKQIYDITGRELDLGLLGLAEFLPAALLVLVTGTIADRYDRRRVAQIALFGEFVVFAFLAVYALSDPTAVWPLFVAAVAFGTCRAFAAPATRSMPPMVAPEGALHRVVALNSATWTSAVVVGPSVSGILYAVHPALAYATAAVLVAVGMFWYSVVRFRRQPPPTDPEDRPTLHHALEGLRFVRRTPMVLAAISLDLFAVLFGGAVALLPAIAEDRLGVGDIAYGFLRAAAGLGAATMAIALAIRPINRRIGVNLFVAVGLFGLATIALGLTRSYAVAFVAIIVLSAADMVSVYIRSTLVPLVTPDDKRGRVLAVEGVFIGASNELGAFESGVAAAAFGTPFAVVSGGAVTLVVVAVWSVVFPDLRRIDRFTDLEGHHDPTTRAP